MNLSKLTLKFVPLLSISLINIFIPNRVFSEVSLHDQCPESGTLSHAQFASQVTNACYSKPDVYRVKIIEVGMCKDNPLATDKLLKTSCAILLSSTTGIDVELASGGNLISKVNINGAEIPEKETYLFSYIVMDSSGFEVSGSYTTTEGTYYSSSQASAYNSAFTGWKTTPPSEAGTYELGGFGSGNCSEGVSHETLSLTGAFLDTNFAISTPVGNDCPNASYLAISQGLDNSVTITSDSPEIDLEFDLTKYGMLIVDQETSPIFSAGMGLGFPIINIKTIKS